MNNFPDDRKHVQGLKRYRTFVGRRAVSYQLNVCISKAKVVRKTHEYDKDDRCVFCDYLKPSEEMINDSDNRASFIFSMRGCYCSQCGAPANSRTFFDMGIGIKEKRIFACSLECEMTIEFQYLKYNNDGWRRLREYEVIEPTTESETNG